jgi:hypothetical protein
MQSVGRADVRALIRGLGLVVKPSNPRRSPPFKETRRPGRYGRLTEHMPSCKPSIGEAIFVSPRPVGHLSARLLAATSRHVAHSRAVVTQLAAAACALEEPNGRWPTGFRLSANGNGITDRRVVRNSHRKTAQMTSWP